MLDWARELLGKADSHGAWKEGVKLGNTAPAKKNSAVILSNSAPLLQSSIVSDTRSNSPGKKVRASQTMKERRSWKDYAEKESKSVSGLKGVDSEKFADLDDYLRGGAETLAARRARQKEAYVKKRVAELQEGSVTFEDPETGKLKDDKAVQNMYRGTVLLAFEDTPDCLDAKLILDEAFFDVEIARDGRQAINMFMLHEGGYDCILVQRNLPLSDAFSLTQQIRESEKVERKRAAAQAAACLQQPLLPSPAALSGARE
jgi:CheY-like chemotaxis protein